MKKEEKMNGKRRSLAVEEEGGESRRQNQRKKINREKRTRKISQGRNWESKAGQRKGEAADEASSTLVWWGGGQAGTLSGACDMLCTALSSTPSPRPPPLNTAINDEGGSSCGGAISS